MREPRWYVVQVETGRERQAVEAARRACEGARDGRGRELLRECFVPMYEAQVKLHGKWVGEQRRLLPGYMVAVTDDPWRLARLLGRVPALTRVLRLGETYAPLDEPDREWLDRWTRPGERTVPMSVARKVGETVVVTEGPLKGLEGHITKVRRRKAEAEIALEVNGKRITATVGLAVLPDAAAEAPAEQS